MDRAPEAELMAGLRDLHASTAPLVSELRAPAPAPSLTGALAIASQSAPLLQACVRTTAHPPGFTALLASPSLDDATIAAWLDLVARHPDTRAIGLILQTLHPSPLLQERLRTVCAALPIVALLPGADAQHELLACWLHEQGVLTCTTLTRFASLLRALGILAQRPASPLRIADNEDAADLSHYLAAHLGHAGLRAGLGGDPPHDLTILPTHEHGPRAQCGPSLTGAPPDAPQPDLPIDDLAPGFAALDRWERWLQDPPPTTPFRPERARLRELAARIAAGTSAGDAERARPTDNCRDLAAACGLAAARELRVSFPDDALVAAAELGYPVALLRADAPWDEPPRIAPDSRVLMEHADALLRPAPGRLLELRAHLAGAPELLLRLERHPTLGPVCTLHHASRTLHTFGWPAAHALRDFLATPSAPSGLIAARSDSLRRICRALCHTLHELGPVTTLTFRLQGTPTGDFLLGRLRIHATR